MVATPATRPTDVDPRTYCASLPTPRRQDEGPRLIALFEQATGADAVMWGPSIIGFGEHDGWPIVGFSPRKAALSFYGLTESPQAPALLERLGKHRLGKGCLYVNGLRDIDEDVLRELIAAGWDEE